MDATVFYNVSRDGEMQNLYFIVRTEGRDFLLRATSQKEKDEWIKAIANECVRYNSIYMLAINNLFLEPSL